MEDLYLEAVKRETRHRQNLERHFRWATPALVAALNGAIFLWIFFAVVYFTLRMSLY